MNKNSKKIILIDGNSLMFRSYYATAYTNNLMQNKKGLYTNAVFGFCNMLNKLLCEEYDNIFVAFDAGKKTFRHQQYQDYKGGRKPLPDEMRVQIPYIKKFLDILKIKRYETLDFEADDLIASVANLAEKNDFEKIKVITGDKDLLQLVDDKISVFITRKGVGELEEFNSDNFYEKMNFTPIQVPDYKGLVGDTSDNLPGIKGIGEKTALKLLKDFNTLENVVSNVSLLNGKVKENIEKGYKMGLKCKMLATLKKDIDLEFCIDDTRKQNVDINDLVSFYKELEFDSFIKKLNIRSEQREVEEGNVKIIDSYDFSNFKDSIINLEVFGNNYYNGTPLGLAIKNDFEQLFIPFDKIKNNKSLLEYLASKENKKITFDYKKLYVVLKKNDIEIKGVIFDVLLATYLINPSLVYDDLKKISDSYINSNLEYDEVVYGFKSKATIPSINRYSNHAINKCNVISNLLPILKEELEKLDQTYLFNEELSLSEVLGDMELNGLKINLNNLDEIGKDLEVRQNEVAKEIYNLADEEFNINSVKQLGEILFVKLQLPMGKKNKTGYSTNSEVLEKLSSKYEIAAKVLEYRAITKIISTYVYGLREVCDENGFVHPLYKQALTLTGRLSSVNPNIQNMPIRTKLGQVIRGAFVSRFENGKIMSSDYSQIELRVLAHMSNDETMIQMFNDSIDFHTQTAKELYDVKIDDVTDEMRRNAKAINFGIVYGMSAWGLSESINISPNEATMYINKYFYKFSKVKEFLDKTVSDAILNGYTKTIFNRIRYIEELKSSNKMLYNFGERTAMNAPIQGSAADIIKIAMNKVKSNMHDLKSILIAQVHDELVFDVYPGEEGILSKIVKENMENAVDLKVKTIAKVSIGESWLKA